MVSHIRAAAQRLVAALDEARAYLPPRLPVGQATDGPPLSVDAPTGLPAGLADTTFPFVGRDRMERASAHQKLALAICEKGARMALADITARLHAGQACAVWKPTLGVAMDDKGRMSLWLDGRSPGDAVAKAVLPKAFETHVEALAFAFRLCAPIDQTRWWTFNAHTFRYPAQDAVDAILLGVALFAPSAVRTVARGGYVQADVAERFDGPRVLEALHRRVAAVLPPKARASVSA